MVVFATGSAFTPCAARQKLHQGSLGDWRTEQIGGCDVTHRLTASCYLEAFSRRGNNNVENGVSMYSDYTRLWDLSPSVITNLHIPVQQVPRLDYFLLYHTT
ncbi:uncharacterized protein H6S33_012847 [Morchella sextelata]|uniref:uncharacterized protein n=1 Tax=Morchella sextelata TaxID=1174677 RepID=UPI001D038EEC|nr:uncharacterized protein H6S33_012847 [Morchella sextelata]KAH0609361.1 hypothetical protein H6S33_012847 [Morchella sextelata]